MKKIHFSLLFLVCLICLLLTSPVSAATSGTCGEQLTWEFDSTNETLTISGSGEMDIQSNPPWWDIRSQVKHIVLEEGVTTVGHRAFSGLSQLLTVQFPQSLQRIEDYGFQGCSRLSNPTFGANLTWIGGSAFSGCSSITNVTIPSGVTIINNSTFSHCQQLQQIVFHNGITEISGNAFFSCPGLTSITIPDSVATIDSAAFSNCKNLSEVDLGKGVQSINNSAFSDCSKLKVIHIPDSVIRIGRTAFSDCSALHTVTIGAGVSDFEESAFSECFSLSGITVSAKNPYYYSDNGVVYTVDSTLFLVPCGFSGAYEILPGTTTIGHAALEDCTKLTSLTMPDSITEIKSSAFMNCSSLRELIISRNITKIGSLCFCGCSNLSKIVFIGMAPLIDETAFSWITATVYYPPSGAGWTNSQKQYSGSLTWLPIACNGNHTIQVTTGTPATCTKTGLSDSSSCRVCGEILSKAQVIPVLEHAYGEWVEITPATLESSGLEQRTCSACGKIDEKVLPQLEPEPTEPPATEPSVTEPPATDPSATEPAETSPTEPVNNTPAKDTNITLILVVALAAITVVAGIIIAITVHKRNKT